MKKLITYFFIISAVVFVGCKQENKDKESETSGDTSLIRGEFIYIDNAAVIKGEDFIYGVQIDDKMKELSEKIKPLKRDEYDMVPVVIQGIIKDNPEEGWEKIVEIQEIVGVTEPTSVPATRIQSQENQKDSVN